MSYRNREIETKLIIRDRDLATVNAWLQHWIGHMTKMISGKSTDTYWAVNNPDVTADFIRIRDLGNSAQLTVKGKDRGTNLNRLEIDVDVESSLSKVTRLVQALLGKPSGTINKEYYVYWLDEHTNISCYQVTEPAYPHIIVEIEGITEERVLELESSMIRSWGDKIERAPGSLYEMLVLKESK